MSDLYNEWLEVNAALKEAKYVEIKLRDAICAEFLEHKLEGSITSTNDGLKITATARLTRTIDIDALDAIWGDLSDLEKLAINYKPSLVLAKYRTLEEQGSILMDAITVKPGQSSLKIVPVEIKE